MRFHSFVGLRSLVLLSVLFVAACDSCEKKPEAVPDAGTPTEVKDAGTVTVTADAAPPESVASADAGAKHDMGNCPTSVAHADVVLKDIEGGVEVTITGKDETTTKEIRERTKRLAEADKKDAGGAGQGKHDHSGSGGGTTGRCTIIMRDTKLVTADVPNGSKVTVTPKDKTELDWLRREMKERAKEAKLTTAEGAGAQRMANCPSAVEGAKTTVKDSKDGVIVTITGDKVDDIRTRAKHAADVAKVADAGKVEHSGSGTGGGGLGRCPIVVEGDTTVDVKEIPGGVEVEVKSKKDVAALQKEAKLRAANFGAK